MEYFTINVYSFLSKIIRRQKFDLIVIVKNVQAVPELTTFNIQVRGKREDWLFPQS